MSSVATVQAEVTGKPKSRTGQPACTRTWSVEFYFHAMSCDVQLAVGTFDAPSRAERVAAQTPSLVMHDGYFYLHFDSRLYLAPAESVQVHGDLPRTDERGASPDFAFVHGWVFPAAPTHRLDTSTREVGRLWLRAGDQTATPLGLRAMLLQHLHDESGRAPERGVRAENDRGRRVDELFNRLLLERWFDHTLGARHDGETLQPTTRLLSEWPSALDAGDR